MKLIALTSAGKGYGQTVYINPATVVAVEPSRDGDEIQATWVHAGCLHIPVVQSPGEIAELVAQELERI